MNKLVAVYGTLKQGFGNHRLLQHCTKVGTVDLEGWDMYSLGGFPAVCKGNGTILAEVYEVEDLATMVALDRLEGYRAKDEASSFYLRRTVDTPFGDAYMYMMEPNDSYLSGRPKIADGDWRPSGRCYSQRVES